jgi:hypothetical protein
MRKRWVGKCVSYLVFVDGGGGFVVRVGKLGNVKVGVAVWSEYV